MGIRLVFCFRASRPSPDGPGILAEGIDERQPLFAIHLTLCVKRASTRRPSINNSRKINQPYSQSEQTNMQRPARNQTLPNIVPIRARLACEAYWRFNLSFKGAKSESWQSMAVGGRAREPHKPLVMVDRLVRLQAFPFASTPVWNQQSHVL